MTVPAFVRDVTLAVFACAWTLGFSAVALAHGDGGAAAPAEATGSSGTYSAKSTGTRKLVAGPVWIKMLVEESNLGSSEIEIGELNLPAGFTESGPHQHGSLEIFYVVSGVLGHEVNGVQHRLEPGEIGIVKPGDSVNHAVLSEDGVKTLVIWVPGGEAGRLIEHAGFQSAPLE